MSPQKLAQLLMVMHGAGPDQGMQAAQMHGILGVPADQPMLDGTFGELKPPYDKVYSDYIMGRMSSMPKSAPGTMLSVQKADTQ